MIDFEQGNLGWNVGTDDQLAYRSPFTGKDPGRIFDLKKQINGNMDLCAYWKQ